MPSRARTGPSIRHLLVVSCLALSGCTGLGPEFVTPDAPVTSDWQPQAEAILSSEAQNLSAWWSALGDPELDSLIDKALGQNLSLQIAGVRILVQDPRSTGTPRDRHR